MAMPSIYSAKWSKKDESETYLELRTFSSQSDLRMPIGVRNRSSEVPNDNRVLDLCRDCLRHAGTSRERVSSMKRSRQMAGQ